MSNCDVKTETISLIIWGNKKDPTEYDYATTTIRIREDYFNQMRKSNPISIHWFYHEYAHYLIATKFGKDFILKNSLNYPDNAIERIAFAYQFYYLMQSRVCSTIDELFHIDPYFRHKKLYQGSLSYYWNNANFILDEFNKAK